MEHTAKPQTAQRLLERGPLHSRPAPPGAAAAVSRVPAAVLLLLASLTAACSSSTRPTRPILTPSIPGWEDGVEYGVASWYGPGFNGRRTANGERYDMHDFTAAHPSLPFGTFVEVRNPRSGRAAVVRINDRGPFKKRRVIDLSYAAAMAIGMVGPGTAAVEVRLVDQLASRMRYTVQVGAFSDPDRAVRLHRDIKRVYPEAFVHADGIWNRVQVGLFDDRTNAESLRRELAVMGVSAVVVAAH